MLLGGPSRLRVNEAGEEKAEEGVGVGVETDLGVGDIRRVGKARFGEGKTFFVDADVHALDGAEAGIDKEGNGHGVKEGGRFLAPLVIEQREGIGERGALAEEKGALDLVQLQLGGVERHDEERHSGSEELLCGGNVIQDVPFGLRGVGRRVAQIAVAALDGAAHQKHALELAKGGRVLVDGGADIHQGADGDQGDLARVATNLLQDETDSVGMRWLRSVAAFGITALGERAFDGRGRTGCDGDLRAAHFG